MLGAMTSLTGGGGLQGGASGPATSGNHQSTSSGFQGANVKAGGGLDLETIAAIGVVALVLVLAWKKA